MSAGPPRCGPKAPAATSVTRWGGGAESKTGESVKDVQHVNNLKNVKSENPSEKQ